MRGWSVRLGRRGARQLAWQLDHRGRKAERLGPPWCQESRRRGHLSSPCTKTSPKMLSSHGNWETGRSQEVGTGSRHCPLWGSRGFHVPCPGHWRKATEVPGPWSAASAALPSPAARMAQPQVRLLGSWWGFWPHGRGGVGGGAALSPPGGTDPSLPGPHPHFTCHRWTPNTAAVLARGPRGHSSAQSRRVTAASHQVENLGEKRWQGRTGKLSDWQWHWQCGLTGSGRELPSSRSSPDFHGPRPAAPPARGAVGPPCSLVPPFLPCSHLL